MAAERSQSLFPTEASSWCKGTIPVPVCLPSSGTWLEWVDPAARYCANSLEASAWSMGAINLRESGISESSRLRAVFRKTGRQHACSRFRSSLWQCRFVFSIPAIPKSGKDFLEDRDKAVQCQCVRVRPDVKDLMQENDHILHTGQEALAQILAPVK